MSEERAAMAIVGTEQQQPILQVTGVNWWREDTQILNNIDWTVQPGENWCVLGLNGSGKTTLLQMIVGYLWPTRGKVEVLGHKFGECVLQEVRKSIGWVSNSLVENLNPRATALHTVISGKSATLGFYEKWGEEEEVLAEQVMQKLQIESLAAKRFGQLSQGERQKVLIARALINQPKLLIFDEPCTGLDLFMRENVLQTIDALGQDPDGPTILYVTHYIEEIMPCFSHVLLMGDGQVAAQGTKEEVLTEAHLSQTYRLPLQVEWENGRPWVRVNR